jgi:hypothetical protein
LINGLEFCFPSTKNGDPQVAVFEIIKVPINALRPKAQAACSHLYS